MAALLILQARGRTTARQLAAELEVSVKTARRDLEALAAAGIPVYATAGKGGGWELLGGARTDLSGLTAAEARALFLVAGPSASVAPEVKAALRKLVRALPETFRREALAAGAALVVDPAAWGKGYESPPPLLAVLESAVVDRVRVRMAYANRDGAVSERTVDPLGLAKKGSTWYLLAGTDRRLRTFRVDRVRSAEPTGEPARRPEAFDLAAAWREVAEATEARRRRMAARVRVRTRLLPGLREQFGADMAEPRPLDEEWSEVEIRRVSAEIIADELAGWGRDVEVQSPEAVRGHLARLGAELVAIYAASPPRRRRH
ncbi:MAG: helix-turn-helix transcriptional regulator [Acidimicrobiales bacterium]